jgi:hypothetical protein
MRSSLLGKSASLICLTATASPVPQLKALYTDPKAPLPRHSPRRCHINKVSFYSRDDEDNGVLCRPPRPFPPLGDLGARGVSWGHAHNPSTRDLGPPSSLVVSPCGRACRAWHCARG